MKKAVHFGAGNIGRGFIGQLLAQSGYAITFVDVAKELVADINALGKYYVEIVGDEPKRILVENVRAIDSDENPEALFEAISDADLVTTAIGPNILQFVAPKLAKGLERRIGKTNRPLNVIACENMVGGSSALKNFVFAALDDAAKEKIAACVGFPDAAVDRIVPLQKNDEKLLVKTEAFAEWDVDATKVVGERPPVRGLTYVENLSAYIERKLFTLNTGHACIAYLAYQKRIPDIRSAMRDEEILQTVREVWAETSELLIGKYGFDRDAHREYVLTAEKRFANPAITDEVTRVARGPKRKLGAGDRLVSPAVQLMRRGIKPHALAKTIAAALKFDFAADKEAAEIQKYIEANGIEKAVTHFTEIPQDSELFAMIAHEFAKF